MKRVRRVIFLAVCIALLTVSAFAAGAQVDDMQVALTVDQNGTARAETSLHVVMEEPMDTLTIGLGPNVSGVHVDGYGAHVAHVGNQTSVELVSESGLPSALELHISYTIRNTVQSTNDTQHFAVRLLGGLKDADIQKLTATVQMPAPFEAIPEFSSGYYAEGIDNYLTISVSEEGVLTASNTEPMLAGETLDLRLDADPGFFTLHNEAGRTLSIDHIVMALLVLIGAIYWWRSLRNPLPLATPQTRAPMGVEPGTAAMLICGEAPDLALMVMNWAASGYLRVVQRRRQKLLLMRLMPMGNERSSYEQAVFTTLFGQEPDVLCGSKAWKAAEKKAKKSARHYWNSRIFEKNPGRPAVLRVLAVLFCGVAALAFADQVVPSMYLRVLLLIGFAVAGLIWGGVLQYGLSRLPMRRRRKPIICLAVCVVVPIVAWRVAGHSGVLFLALFLSAAVEAALLFGPKRRRSGVNQLSELLGWRRQLGSLSPEEAKQLLAADPQYYYRNSLFAEALGVGRKFTKAFAGERLDVCAFIEREGKPVPRQAEKFHPFFRNALAIARGEAVKKKKRPAKKTVSAKASRSKKPADGK